MAAREQILAEIGERGPMAFERFVEIALYGPDGFYATTGRAGGRRGDFITSVEAGPLFAAVIADWLDKVWVSIGAPTEFLVAEAGAGVGTLFRGINRAAPACFEALTYTLVERSEALRAAHIDLPGDRWRSSAELPTAHQHVVVANELLDNLAFGIAELTDHGWTSVQVGVVDDDLALIRGEVKPELASLTRLAPGAVAGSRVPVASGAAAWLHRARAGTDRILIFDYGATTAELAERGPVGWLRTYGAHQRGSDPFEGIGQLDITHDVPVDQLPAATVSKQADWLVENGIGDRVERARAVWAERSSLGDLEAMVARSAINEAEALTDRAGLGGFVVLEWF